MTANEIGRIGLSPLARGTLAEDWREFSGARFIPAGAGNSLASLPLPDLPSVYPRWRGELIGVLTDIAHRFGLSPLARGTRQRSNALERPPRFIPAGAGNSS